MLSVVVSLDIWVVQVRVDYCCFTGYRGSFSMS